MSEKKTRLSMKKAKLLIKQVINSGMYRMGVVDEKPATIECDDLLQLIRANEKVEQWNKSDKAKTATGRTVCMTVADRGLAATYTAMHFEGGSLKHPNIVAYANGNYVLVIAAKYFNRQDNHQTEEGTHD